MTDEEEIRLYWRGVDKYDKLGWDGVVQYWINNGADENYLLGAKALFDKYQKLVDVIYKL